MSQEFNTKRSTARNMTQGPIMTQMVLFALPLLLGNVFQLLYNTVDTLVVGNFVSTQALAAVGSTTMIINLMVFFFNGLSIGATVAIGQRYGAAEKERLHIAIETTMALTFMVSIVFTAIGISFVSPMLKLMATPADVIPEATVYLRIYFAGISGLMIYNMGSGILRAVGDSTRPLYFLIFTSVLNIVLDLLFVIVFRGGIAGVAFATILSQFVSAFLVLMLLTRTDDIYKMTWIDLRIDRETLGLILGVGLPAALQTTITAFSNVFVQSYINSFGSACMAGWSCYNKLDQFVYLPMSSLANSATTFVSQNIGAKQEERANRGTFAAISLAMSITAVLAVFLFFLAEPAASCFTKDRKVVEYCALFIHTNIFFLILNCVSHVLAGALRGRGDSKASMYIMIGSFVVVRQTYLFVMSHYISNTEKWIGFGYPVGWTVCFFVEMSYFLIRYRWRKRRV